MGFFDFLFKKRKQGAADPIQQVSNEKQDATIITDRNADGTEIHQEPLAEIEKSLYGEVSIHECSMNALVADKLKKHFIAFDTETTGLDQEADRIVEIGAVEFLDGQEVRRFSTLVKSDVKLSPMASHVNHITDDMLKNAPSEKKACLLFAEFLGNAKDGETLMCAYNASFDFGFLTRAFTRCGVKADISYIDALYLSKRNLTSIVNYKQDTVARHFGFENTNSHRAVSDAEICGKILIKLLELGESSYLAQREEWQKMTPTTDELEVCAVIQNILENASEDTEWLRFRKTGNNDIDCSCLYSFFRFKFAKKGRYAVLPYEIADNGDFVCDACSDSEGGVENRRVFFSSPKDMEKFSDYIIMKFRETKESMERYVGLSKRSYRLAKESIELWYKLDPSEAKNLLTEVEKKDYSDIAIPIPEKRITRDDVTINANYNRIPFKDLPILENAWDETLMSVFDQAERARKDGRYEEAISIYEKCREAGLTGAFVYKGFAMAYHSMKDYDNEIAILDEGIACHHGDSWEAALTTRRETAIKALYKKQEAERTAILKQEEKQKKREEREIAKQKEKEEKQASKERLKKAVLQLDDDGNIMAEYPSITEASIAVGINSKSIRDAAKGVQKHAAGFCWRYKEDT